MNYERENFTIDWSDTEFKKYLHTVKIVEEGWFYTKVKHDGKLWKKRDNYYIVSKTNKHASTNGTTGFCDCESFKTAKPKSIGIKKPCKHLWKCRDLMDAWNRSHNEYMSEYMEGDKQVKNRKICNHLESVKDDPNSLFTNEAFVREIIKKGREQTEETIR